MSCLRVVRGVWLCWSQIRWCNLYFSCGQRGGWSRSPASVRGTSIPHTEIQHHLIYPYFTEFFHWLSLWLYILYSSHYIIIFCLWKWETTCRQLYWCLCIISALYPEYLFYCFSVFYDIWFLDISDRYLGMCTLNTVRSSAADMLICGMRKSVVAYDAPLYVVPLAAWNRCYSWGIAGMGTWGVRRLYTSVCDWREGIRGVVAVSYSQSHD